MIPGFGAVSTPVGLSELAGFGDPGFNINSLLIPQLLSGGGNTQAVASQLASTVGYPSQAADNPAFAAAAGQGSTSGGLGAMLQGIQAPAAPKPIFGSAAGGQSVPAPHQNAQMPLAISQALKLLPGAQRAGLPTLGNLIKGTL